MPYKYVAKTASKPFEHASDAVRAARSRLSWAMKHFSDSDSDLFQFLLGTSGYCEFNELLLLGYFERQKIDVSAQTP